MEKDLLWRLNRLGSTARLLPAVTWGKLVSPSEPNFPIWKMGITTLILKISCQDPRKALSTASDTKQVFTKGLLLFTATFPGSLVNSCGSSVGQHSGGTRVRCSGEAFQEVWS